MEYFLPKRFFKPDFMGNVIFFCNNTYYIYRKANEVFGLSLCRNKLYEFKKTYEYFNHKIEIIYKEIYGKSFEEKNLQSILLIDPILYNFKNQKEHLIYIYAKNYEILKEFLEKMIGEI